MMYNYYCAYDKYNYYLNVIKSIFDLEQCDFENRYIVHRAFLEHPSVFIKALFQYKIYNCRDWIRNDRYSIFISEDRNIPFGLWKDNVKRIYCSDIITLYAGVMNICYKDAVSELILYIDKHRKIFSGYSDNNKILVQEKTGIYICGDTQCDDFSNFVLECVCNEPKEYIYYKNNERMIGRKICFKNNKGNLISYFDTLWRKHNSVEVYHIHLPPDIPYMNYGMEYLTDEKIDVYFHETEEDVICNMDNRYQSIRFGDVVHLASPYGNQYLDKTDFSELQDRKIIVEWNGMRLKENFLDSLFKETQKYNINIDFHNRKIPYGGMIINYNELIKKDEYIEREPINEEIKTTSSLLEAGEVVSCNSDTQEKLLHPIIEKGRIVWIYAKSGSGKTHFAVNIAYAVSKGNTKIGDLFSDKSHSVLYIHGEMRQSDIINICNDIKRGYGEENIINSAPFGIYSFAQSRKNSKTIFDEIPFSINNCLYDKYDLIIFDSYFSLNGNRYDAMPFIRFLQSLVEKNIDIVVIDHTNTDGELQGSINKYRCADLVMKIIRNDDIITVNYPKARF